MECKQYPSNKQLIPIHEEKLIREVNYDTITGTSTCYKKNQNLCGLDKLLKKTTHFLSTQKVFDSKKTQRPAIKTIYLAEKSRFCNKKGSHKSSSRLATGDHLLFTTQVYDNELNDQNINSNIYHLEKSHSGLRIIRKSISSSNTNQIEISAYETKFSQVDNTSHDDQLCCPRPTEKCYIYAQRQTNMNLRKSPATTNESVNPNKIDIATLIITTSSEDNEAPSVSTISKLNKRIERLERKIIKQETYLRSIDPNYLPLSSSRKESKRDIMKSTSASEKPGCSYIEYSHIPEISAFQRYAQQAAAPLSPSKATTLEKEHNSEQYGRDYTAYDGITARGRRQCASVPCKRDDAPRQAAERIHKIRHKLNPVRDYRLMDTVHYLAQGEFAPRDDGIKLTSSREAVLSDIIWEDVCRTHWPNIRLGRRGHSDRRNERCSTRCELQRLIDSLLKERVAHVERRKRRHYRIVKLNHRHESCRPVGKTGDIIVASHKNRQTSEDVLVSDQNTGSWDDRHTSNRVVQKHRSRHDECCPGTSYATKTSSTREPTCCYQTANPKKRDSKRNMTSGSTISACKSRSKHPKLVIKKENSRRKHENREKSNLEHLVLLPTLVLRTPSNIQRQQKFNELYHRILNNAHNGPVITESNDQTSKSNVKMKDIGFNINITLSDSLEHFNKKK